MTATEVSPRQAALDAVTELHTLGPAGTNCEAAAHEWFRRRGSAGSVVLHATLEQALEAMGRDPHVALLSCIVYPELHTLVFSNLERLELSDAFIMPTYNMVVAVRPGTVAPKTFASHPAPRLLAPDGVQVRLVESNARAAVVCAAGEVGGCVTTLRSADDHGLRVIMDAGAVPMGFAIHTNRAAGGAA